MAKGFCKLASFSLLFTSCSVFAAQAIDLSQQDVSILRTLSSQRTSTLRTSIPQTANIQEIKRSIDFNNTLHIRMQQSYAGYPVWGSDAVVHVPHDGQLANHSKGFMSSGIKKTTTMTGTMYANLQQDLANSSADIFKQAQAEKAITKAFEYYKSKNANAPEPIKKNVALKVYVDDENKAHWVFHVNLYLKTNDVPIKPNFLMDAESFKFYRVWNEVKGFEKVKAGGFGGNIRMGKLVYDGLSGHLTAFDIFRDAKRKMCYLKNNIVRVTDYRRNGIARFKCEKPNADHNDVYWNEGNDAINSGYSPNNDALFAGIIVSNLYQSWYNIPVLTENNKPLVLHMVTHSPNYDFFGVPDHDNAMWDPEEQKMYFGDGETVFYPLTSVGVSAHEISHGFTEQHSNLNYFGQSGGLNESFSDMAAQAAEYFAFGKNSWQIGKEISKANRSALRYMDEPSRDCRLLENESPNPGDNCSIDSLRDYDGYLVIHHLDPEACTRTPDVHFSSGVFNRAFYLLAKAPGWDVKKAFDVMVQANRFYWTSSTTFIQAACSVTKATKDYGYDQDGVTQAFAGVGIDTKLCR